MDLVFNATTGRYLVLLGGVLWDNCTTDADCPGRATCAKNETWSQVPAQCHCSFVMDFTGADCNSGKFFKYIIW